MWLSFDPVHKVIPAFVTGRICQQNADTLLEETKRKGSRGRFPNPKRIPPEDLLYAQVVKHRRKGRVVKVTHKVIFGTHQALAEYLEHSPVSSHINTAFVERQNGRCGSTTAGSPARPCASLKKRIA